MSPPRAVVALGGNAAMAATSTQLAHQPARGLSAAEARRLLIPMKQLESAYIAWVVGRCGGNKTQPAQLLGIDVSTIHRKGRTAGLR